MARKLYDFCNAALRHARAAYPKDVMRASDLYADVVVPTGELIGAALLTFADWFLFDYRLEGGPTPFAGFAAGLPAGPCRDDACRIAETNRFASFAYEKIRRRTGLAGEIAVVTDIETEATIALEDGQLTDHPEWVGSLVTGRVAQTADGAWHAASQVFFRDRMPLEVARSVAEGIRDQRGPDEALSMAFAARLFNRGAMTDSLPVRCEPI